MLFRSLDEQKEKKKNCIRRVGKSLVQTSVHKNISSSGHQNLFKKKKSPYTDKETYSPRLKSRESV